jgi:hypothetical protein
VLVARARREIEDAALAARLAEFGIEKERRRALEEKLKTIPKLAARKMSAPEVADILGLEVAVVRREMGKKS